jgi:glycosyltransferase involved in cell wall biosynthesis
MTIRVLHGPTVVGGNAWTLSRAERRLGLVSDLVVTQPDAFGYQADRLLALSGRPLADRLSTLVRFIAQTARDYDVIHFNFGRTFIDGYWRFPFLNQRDLALFHAMGKAIVVTYQGCDVRQKTFCIEHFDCCACAEPDCYGGLCTTESDARKAARARVFDRYADAVLATNPDLLWVLRDDAQFLAYTAVDLDEWKVRPSTPQRTGAPFRILHAPTDTGGKGTRYVVEAVSALQGRHPEVELLLVQGVPHDGVRDLYARADLVVDQLLAGWYGAFAVEAMALGKPVVCYIRESDKHFLPGSMATEMPLINATPTTIGSVLAECLARRDTLPELGLRGRAYVERWHDPVRVAGFTKGLYERILQDRRTGTRSAR